MIPRVRDLLFPILGFISKNDKVEPKQIIDFAVQHFNIDENARAQINKSGEPTYRNRIGWSIHYLGSNKKIPDDKRLIERVSRAVYEATSLGKEIAKSQASFDSWYQEVYGDTAAQSRDTGKTPDENLDESLDEMRDNIKSELLGAILKKEPREFEALVLTLLKKMGYGVNVSLTQNGPDGGIDGIIDEDVLGFSKIYIQAKRYSDAIVSSKHIKEFVGTLSTKSTKKGLFITTSKFAEPALKFAAEHQSYQIVLIDADKLAELLLEYEVGVQVKQVEKIYQIDRDFWEGSELE